MKILAIRGHNLASLPTFEVCFNTGHLARAGAFAICGPTGAGKSTIFDALCLAIFGETPRYRGAGHAIGTGIPDDDDKLKSGDPRGILRRGTGEGWAEAEFTGIDGLQYRGRWTVWRAGKRPKGKPQPALHTIVACETGQVVTSGVTPVAEWVAKYIGLTLEQFTRSVMLPQGEFAAFLKASAKDRSALLEKVTDSTIYREIGVLAYDRWRKAAGAHENLDLQRKAIKVMADARPLTEQQRVEAIAAAAAAKMALGQAQTHVAWFARLDALRLAVGVAAEAVETANAAWTAAGPTRGDLERTDLAEPLRAAVVAAALATKRSIDAEKAATAAAATAAVAGARAALATAGAAAAEQTLTEASTALANARPQLDDARVRDAKLLDLASQAAKSKVSADQAAAELAAAQADWARTTGLLERLRGEAEAAASWLAAHAEVAGLSERWTLADKLLVDFASAKAELSKHTGHRASLEAALTLAAAGLANAKAEAEATSFAHAGAAALLERAEAEATRHPESAILAARGAHEAARTRLERLGALARDAERVAAELAKAREDAAASRGQAAAHRAVAEASGARLTDLTPRHEEAVRARDQALRTSDFAVHRPALVEGDACPLCGALDHPYAALPPVLDALLRDLEGRVTTLAAELKTGAASQAHELAHAKAADALTQRAEARSSDHQSTATQLAAAWQAAGGADTPSAAALTPDRADLERLDGALKLLEISASAARKAESEAKQAERARRTAKDAAALAERGALGAAEVAGAVLKRSDEAATAQSERLETCLRELTPGFVGWAAWEARLHADPAGFRDQCKDDVESFRSHTISRDRATEAIGKAEVEGSALAQRSIEKQALAEAAALAATEHAATLANERKAREAIFGGEAAERVEARLVATEATARGAAITARDTAKVAGEEAAGLVAGAGAAQQSAQASALEATQLIAARDGAVALAGFLLPEVEARLSRDPRLVSADREALALLTRVLVEARLTLQSRDGDLRVHESAARPDVSPEEAVAAQAAAQAEIDLAIRTIGALEQALRSDDEALALRAAFDDELAQLAVILARWGTLKDLIGDANGHVFSKFAQSITLDVLVGQANVQLATLAPRYRLQRVPNLELELQVIDRDNADDVRSLTSLSGGETFLASLALALGLASIASKNLNIGSLFIDEGFGTLDTETLKVAVGVLDGLRASGRQVGIISHVEGLAELLGAWVSVEKVTSTRSKVTVGEPLPSARAE